MTDARLRGEWLNAMQFDDLSDAAWRVFTGALMWSAENGTDGLIPKRYLRMLHPAGEQATTLEELVHGGLWSRAGNDFRLVDWDGKLGQSTAVHVETYKQNGRLRARKYREKERSKLAKAVASAEAGTPTVETSEPDQVTSDVTRDVRTNVGKGKGEGKRPDGEGSYFEKPEETYVEERPTQMTWAVTEPGTGKASA